MVLKNNPPHYSTATMTQLYGGAISADLPADAIDVSGFRQIPDTQEVFLLEQPDKLDRLVIFDLLEQVKASDLTEIIATHLEDIIEGPPQFLAPLETIRHVILDTDVHTFLVKPEDSSKQETPQVKLFMFVVIIRLDNVDSDAVITFNVPCHSETVTQEKFNNAVTSVFEGKDTLGECYIQLKHWISTFKVQDWALFA